MCSLNKEDNQKLMSFAVITQGPGQKVIFSLKEKSWTVYMTSNSSILFHQDWNSSPSAKTKSHGTLYIRRQIFSLFKLPSCLWESGLC